MPENTKWIRVSCAALCRIEHVGYGFFMVLNLNRREKGLYQLSPIGGGLHFLDSSILSRFDALPESHVEPELRLMLPVTQLPAFRTWFYSGQGRETSPFRELYEELVCEAKLLTALKPEDMQCERLWTVEREQFTERAGHTGLLTHYFLEVYAVRFTATPVLAQLIAAPPESGARWLHAEQITNEAPIPMHIDGAEHLVRVNGRILLDPPPDHELPAD